MTPKGDATARVEPLEGPLTLDRRWRPQIGPEATEVIAQKKLPPEAGVEIQEVAARILGKGQAPDGPDESRTGLVVGYVQSGKTLSFTTVIALARDNHFPMVIVAAGTKTNLHDQTVERLLKDLGVGRDEGPPRWLHLKNPDLVSQPIIQSTLRDWRDESIPVLEKATLLLTVIKHHQRLDNLNALLAQLDLSGVPVVVIDDEADQASLNTKINDDDESATYHQLLELRRLLPRHTFLQYTATPQAPLLINIIDALSPEFVEVLNPGDGYVGGFDFFGGNRQFTRVIPDNEVPSPDNHITEPPDTLLDALRIFFVGVSAGHIKGWSRTNPNRSMLVHPSRTTQEHFEYFQSIQAIKGDWARILALPESDSDRRDLVALFLMAYRSLEGTVGVELPPFSAIVPRLGRDIERTQVREVNRRRGNRTQDINWSHAYAWILVGGQKMDRGFTVRELTVTYMPRGIGTGNADTLQQRARFFGYKRSYLGFCRIYLESAALAAFEGYVTHEEEMRRQLVGVQEVGESLGSWKRRFFLSPDLRPCRANVVQYDYVRGNYQERWFVPFMLKMDEAVVNGNRSACDEFLRQLAFARDQTYGQVAQQHDVCNSVPLGELLGGLLTRYRVEDPTDSDNLTGLNLQLSFATQKNPGETACVYRMRPRYQASRGVDERGRIASTGALFQGADKAVKGYPGDAEFRDPGRVSVQVHVLDLTEGERRGERRVMQNVPVLAVWVPRRLGKPWVANES